MYIDTHCHLNFSRFKKTLKKEIEDAHHANVDVIVIPGTDVQSSRKAVAIADQFPQVYAAVGIHPHHAYAIGFNTYQDVIHDLMQELTGLITQKNVVAIGEVGLDTHVYENTKYEAYAITPEFITIQAELLKKQIHLAKRYQKSLILHNRETKQVMLELLTNEWDPFFEGRSVFHCCEPEMELLTFAQSHKMYIGVDGDVTYDSAKAEFISHVPLEMLVLETDSPFLLPEPLKSQKQYPNGPRNIPLIAEKVAEIKKTTTQEVMKITSANAIALFQL